VDGLLVESNVPQPFFLFPTAHTALTMAGEGTPQHFALPKGATNQYVAKNEHPICKSGQKMRIPYVNP
jgi:hypothetical protein